MSPPAGILVAIPDPLLRRAIADHLRSAAGLDSVEAAGLEQAVALAVGRRLAVVDEALNPLAFCLRLREAGRPLPLLVLGDVAAERCCGIEAVMPKPLRLPQLQARIREVLARTAAAMGPRIGPWRFDEQRAVLEGEGGAMVRLTAKEAAFLARLLRGGEAVVPREVLLGEVWGYGEGIDTHTLETHVYKLRRKLGSGVLVGESGGYRLARRS